MSFSEYDFQILQYVNHNRIKSLDGLLIFITDTATGIALLIPLIILVYMVIKKQKLSRQAVQMFVAFALNSMVISILKYTINRPRPYEISKSIERLSLGGNPSFPSGHTADVFVTAVSILLLFYRPIWIHFLIFVWAFSVAYSRMALGVHYLSDVIGGMVFATLTALFVNWFFKIMVKTKPVDPDILKI